MQPVKDGDMVCRRNGKKYVVLAGGRVRRYGNKNGQPCSKLWRDDSWKSIPTEKAQKLLAVEKEK